MKTITVWNGGEYGDAPTCDCGNETHTNGFYPALADGTEVEPDDHRWTNGIHKCGNCETLGIVIKGAK